MVVFFIIKNVTAEKKNVVTRQCQAFLRKMVTDHILGLGKATSFRDTNSWSKTRKLGQGTDATVGGLWAQIQLARFDGMDTCCSDAVVLCTLSTSHQTFCSLLVKIEFGTFS